ncbi:ras-related GTP-binding protein C isoform X2 [Planococcus citri]
MQDQENTQDDGNVRPRVLLMGLRRSGKSSIAKVMFQKMQPNETLFLESTSKVVKDNISNSAFVDFELWDLPGQIDSVDPSFEPDVVFGVRGALIFVIDAQDDYVDALNKLIATVTKAYKINTNIRFEVFIHKVDGLTEDNKIETQRDIHQRAIDDLNDSGLDQLQLNFHLTSIYDHSIFEAFSKVVQRLTIHLPFIENLLNLLVSNSAIEKAFLFDVVSKMYIATDSTPVDMQSYELCCDMIDVVIDISCVYGIQDEADYTAFDENSCSKIKLNNGSILYFREVGQYLAVVCILREENFERRGIITYNVLCFRKAIQQLLELMEKKKDEKPKE